MKHLDLTVFEPGDQLATVSDGGAVTLWVVRSDGLPVLEEDGPLAKTKVNAASPIEDLNLSVRTYNLLKREKIETYGDLVDWWKRMKSEGQINPDTGASEIRNFGSNSVQEVYDLLTHGPRTGL